MKQFLGLRTLLTILFGIAATLFFGLAYPHHLHYQEQYQLFLFDADYMRGVMAVPGGVADLLGRFCTQFFLYAWYGAAIIGLLLMAIQCLTARLFDCGRFYGFTFLPASLLWLFMLDEHALLGSLWTVLITLLAIWGWLRLPRRWQQFAALSLAVPLLYWIVGPISLLFFCYVLIVPRNRTSWSLIAMAAVSALPLVLQYYVGASNEDLLQGVHYYRSHEQTSAFLKLGVMAYIVLGVIVLAERRWGRNTSKQILAWLSVAVMLLVHALLLWQNYNPKVETVMAYDYMARHQQWSRIVERAKAETPNNGVTVTALNLALAKKEMLMDHMFEYNQNGLSGLLPVFVRDAMSPLTTAEAFYQLGLVNTAQRFVFEAQEAIPDFQKSARCYKRLAETNLINGNYEVARKYLLALQKTLFYSSWAEKTLQLLGDEDAIARHPEYGRMREMKIDDSFFFSDRETPQMLGRLFMSKRQNRIAYEYLQASFLLMGNLDSFVQCFDMGQSLGYTFIPKHFQEALIMWWSRSHGPNEKMPVQLNLNIVQGLDRFYSLTSTPGMTKEGLARQFGNTYWYYYFTTFKQ